MIKIKNIVVVAFTLGCLSLMPACKSGSSDSSAPIDLKMNFKAGDKYLYTTTINQSIALMQGISMDQNMIMEMIYTTKGDVSGNKTMDITYDHIIMEAKSPMGGMKYDSKNPSPEPSAMGLNVMDSLIGKSFGITVANDGHIVAVTGLDKIVNSFNFGDDSKAQMSIKNQLSDTAIRMMMQNSFDMYPGHPVKVGDSWVKNTQMTFSGIHVDVNNTYMLKSVDAGKAILSLNSLLNLPKTNLGSDSSASEMELTGKQTGDLEIDIATGQVIKSLINSDIKGKMTMQGMPQDINIKGVINVTSKKI